MRSSNNGGDRIPTGHLLLPNKTSSTGTDLLSVEVFPAKGAPWVSPNKSGCC